MTTLNGQTTGLINIATPTLLLSTQILAGYATDNNAKYSRIQRASLPLPKKNIPQILDKRQVNNTETISEFGDGSGTTNTTEKQISCAERLGVDISECNKHGVFTNRTRQISEGILRFFEKNSWDTIKPIMLRNIEFSIRLYFTDSLESIKKNDFDGLTRLVTLYLHKNEITSIEEGAFAPLKNLANIYLSQNYNLTKLPEGIFDNLAQGSPEFTGYRANVYLDRTRITLSRDQFQTLWKKNVGLSYSWPDWGDDEYIEKNSILIGDDSGKMSVHQFVKFVSGPRISLISDIVTIKLGALKEDAFLSFLFPEKECDTISTQNQQIKTHNTTIKKIETDNTPHNSEPILKSEALLILTLLAITLLNK